MALYHAIIYLSDNFLMRTFSNIHRWENSVMNFFYVSITCFYTYQQFVRFGPSISTQFFPIEYLKGNSNHHTTLPENISVYIYLAILKQEVLGPPWFYKLSSVIIKDVFVGELHEYMVVYEYYLSRCYRTWVGSPATSFCK